MSKSTTSKYALDMQGMTSTCWDAKWAKTKYGKVLPTVAQLESFVMEYVVSTYPGYVNDHIGKAYGLKIPSFARIRMNGGNEVKVEWKAPMFMVLPNAADYPAVAKVNF